MAYSDSVLRTVYLQYKLYEYNVTLSIHILYNHSPDSMQCTQPIGDM